MNQREMSKAYLMIMLTLCLSGFTLGTFMIDKIIHLNIHRNTKISDSLSVRLNHFSRTNEMDSLQDTITSAHLSFYSNQSESAVTLSMKVSGTDGMPSTEWLWDNYKISLIDLEFDKSIRFKITNTTHLYRHLSTLSKSQLVEKANEIISAKLKDLAIEPKNYAITAWKNASEIIIKYHQLIEFVPLNKKSKPLLYGFEVHLIDEQISPFDLLGFENYYTPTIDEKNQIEFVKDHLNLPRDGFRAKVVEDSLTYQILLSNETAFARYLIDKITGKETMPPIEGSYNTISPVESIDQSSALIEITD